MTAATDVSKADIRKSLLKARQSLLPEQRQAASKIIADKLFLQSAYKMASTVFAYVSMKNEVQTLSLLAQMLMDKKKVYLPLIVGKREMKIVRLFSLQDLVEGEYGILTVKNDRQEYLTPDELDCAIVPGVGFDSYGNRLGMGGGYYDTLLPHAVKAVKIALAYEVQMVDHIPTELHDCRMDYILTENRIFNCCVRK